VRARWFVAAVLGATACYHFNPDNPCAISCTTTCPNGLTCGTDGLCHGAGGSCPAQDAGIDGEMVGSGSNCYGTGLIVVCFSTPPTGEVPLSGGIDTSPTAGDCPGSASQGSNEPELCVFAGSDIDITGQARITGTRPIVLVATGSITVGSGAMLDAGSQRTGTLAGTGPDADDVVCDPGTLPVGSGGGAGGSFQSRGGNGGNGPTGGTGGVSGNFVGKDFVHGGCKGQPGTGDTTSLGHGGGAVWLIAVGTIEVDGQVDASGEGGAQSTIPIDGGAGSNQFPGAGGGAGGMIGLDAPTIHIDATGVLTAGGGGGAGGGASGGGRGADGNSITACGAKGQAGGGGGDGGSGSSNTQTAGGAGQGGGTAERGYGGGGGAAGFVMTYGTVKNDYVMGANNSNVQPEP
jgi:hypothetical protein